MAARRPHFAARVSEDGRSRRWERTSRTLSHSTETSRAQVPPPCPLTSHFVGHRTVSLLRRDDEQKHVAMPLDHRAVRASHRRQGALESAGTNRNVRGESRRPAGLARRCHPAAARGVDEGGRWLVAVDLGLRLSRPTGDTGAQLGLFSSRGHSNDIDTSSVFNSPTTLHFI